MIAALPPEHFMNFLGIMVDQIKAEKAGNAVINLKLKEGGDFAIDLHNGVFNRVANVQHKQAEAPLKSASVISWPSRRVKASSMSWSVAARRRSTETRPQWRNSMASSRWM